MPNPSYPIYALVSLVQRASNTGTIARLHVGIEREIAAAQRRIEHAGESGDQQCQDAIVDDECDRVEELLGLAFVAAQSFIAGVRTRVAVVARGCESEAGHLPSFCSDRNAYDVLRKGRLLRAGAAFTAVEAIHAVGNYWKHQDDWPTCEQKKGRRLVTIWDPGSMRGNERRTAEIVAELGLRPFSTGNLRAAAKALGVETFEDLSLIREELGRWAHDLCEAIRSDTAPLRPAQAKGKGQSTACKVTRPAPAVRD